MWKFSTLQETDLMFFHKAFDDERILDDEVDKFHEVVMKNQTSIANLAVLPKGKFIKSVK